MLNVRVLGGDGRRELYGLCVCFLHEQDFVLLGGGSNAFEFWLLFLVYDLLDDFRE